MFIINMNSKVFEKELGTLNTKYNELIDGIVSTFPKRPDTDTIFQADIVKLQKIQEDFFIMKRVADKNNETFTQDIKKINNKISSLSSENSELEKKLNNLKASDNASVGVLFDTVALYDRRLLFNKIILVITIAVYASYHFYGSIYSK